MYNVRVLKYPDGWQYRIYSNPVGYKLESDNLFLDNESDTIDVYNPQTNDTELVRADPQDINYNPFTNELEIGKIPVLHIPDRERSMRVSCNRTINTIYHLSRSNVFKWFVTLTFDPDKVDSFDYNLCSKKLHEWLRNCKFIAPDMKYIVVPEKHKSGRYHFHGLFANCDELDFTDSGHKSGNDTVYNIGKYKLGFTTATLIKDNEKTTKYICKYITKELCESTFGRKRYWASRNLDKCEEETLLLTHDDIQKALEYLLPNSKHIKRVVVGELKTIYLEM